MGNCMSFKAWTQNKLIYFVADVINRLYLMTKK